jgi:hypothetical protein
MKTEKRKIVKTERYLKVLCDGINKLMIRIIIKSNKIDNKRNPILGVKFMPKVIKTVPNANIVIKIAITDIMVDLTSIGLNLSIDNKRPKIYENIQKIINFR